MSLVEELALQCSQLEEQLAAFHREQPECWCETCRCVYPVQQPGRILQPCPTCKQEMAPTSFNLRLIDTLRKERDALARQVDVLHIEKGNAILAYEQQQEQLAALNSVIRDDYVEVKGLQLQLAGHQVYSALLREALESCTEGDYSTGHVIHPSFDEKLVRAALALPNDNTVLRQLHAQIEQLRQTNNTIVPSGMVRVKVKNLLAVRDALVDKDCEEAYHQLYTSVDWADPYNPFAEWEAA